MRIIILSTLFLCFLQSGLAQNKGPKFERLTKVPKAIPEISGMYIARDSIWAHNDSGGDPVLYAFDTTGVLLDSVFIEKTINRDWEELANDDQGNVFICDFGNNRNSREDLRIFKWHPQKGWLGTLFLSYADQDRFPPRELGWNFDAEACFWYQDSLYIFTKNRGDNLSNLYVISDRPGVYKPQPRDSIDLQDRMATAAALSPDHKTLAIAAYQFNGQFHSTLFIFRDFTPGNFCDGKMERIKLPNRQFEAVDFWDNETLYLAAEKTPIHSAILGKVSLKLVLLEKEPAQGKQ